MKKIKLSISIFLNLILIISFVLILLPNQFVAFNTKPGETSYIAPTYYAFTSHFINSDHNTWINTSLTLSFLYIFLIWIISHFVLELTNLYFRKLKSENLLKINKYFQYSSRIIFSIVLIILGIFGLNWNHWTNIGKITYIFMIFTSFIFIINNIYELTYLTYLKAKAINFKQVIN
ncbi:hypothetical protein [Mycoplasmopsis columbina]|uniref:Transmembrane protein n=1 Tax=Mycoplasmopsis columbina SF7 TaxID=1037410 RepID=F9UJA4_9BACT|nr:hypothetical protein [Mycoplasmopsis columbina]EGV00523.1 hypothetical protein MCSF7_02811 [Mycoplasmopsis columbina SF7]VEU76871.1 Uncharacterised protein [Mycoplasmopsis columbina]